MSEPRLHTASTSRVNVGYQMAYAKWVTLRHGCGADNFRFFGWWAQMQGQLDNPRPYLLSDEDRLGSAK